MPQDCRRCRGDDDETRQRRSEWGCDGPASKPWGSIRCVECDGDDEKCAACGGSGKTPLDLCPYAAVRATERLMVDAAELAGAGVLACEGAWFEQPATFIDALKLLLRARKRIDDEAARRRKELTGG